MDRWIFTGRDSTCMGDTRTHTARARARPLLYRVRGRPVRVPLSLHTQTPRTPITHALINHARTHARTSRTHRRVTTRGCPLASPGPGTPAPAHADAERLTTMHGLTMTSAVVGTKMTTRATSASSRVSRGALTIVNSGAGPKRVRSNAGTGATARECVGMNGMRARGVGRAVVVLMRDDRGRGTTRARGDDADRWMRGREIFF